MSYVLTPQPGSNTSHQIRTAEALANVPIREALELAKQKVKYIFYLCLFTLKEKFF